MSYDVHTAPTAKRVTISRRNPELKALNELVGRIAESVLQAPDKDAAAAEVSHRLRSFLRNQAASLPDVLQDLTVKFRAIHHGPPPGSPAPAGAQLQASCNPFAWHYVGWYRVDGRLYHTWENECGDGIDCNGHG